MPIYAFHCEACGHDFDRLQKLSDPDPAECPACGKPRVRRQVTAPAFRLAGSGWYETDFKKDGDRKRNLAGKDDASTPKTDKPAGGGTTPQPKADKPAAAPFTGATPAASAN